MDVLSDGRGRDSARRRVDDTDYEQLGLPTTVPASASTVSSRASP